MKKCSKCGELKPFDQYNASKNGVGGKRTECKDCQRAYKTEWHLKNKPTEKRKTKHELRIIHETTHGRKCNSCGEVKALTEYRKNSGNLDSYRRKCKVCEGEFTKQYRTQKPELVKEQLKRSILKNKAKVQQRYREWVNKQMEVNPVYGTKVKIRALLKLAVKYGYKSKSKLNEILGCDYDSFRNHIEGKFTSGMTWENRNEWEIDHIMPLATAVTVEDVIRLNHYTNLQPLWKADNQAKRDKIIVGLQPTHF